MRPGRWLGWAARLYPAWWRRRYSEEFCALLEDLPPGWKDLQDTLRGAFLMHLSTHSTYLPLAAITAVIGTVAGGIASFQMPDRFVSTAVIRDAPGTTDDASSAMLTRAKLSEIILRPALDLYPVERARNPIEDVIETMRGDIHQEPAGRNTRITFTYPDRTKAQAVVQALARGRAQEVVEPASLPKSPELPGRSGFLLAGLVAGAILGLLIAYVRQRPLRRTLVTAGFGLAGAVLAAAAAFATDITYPDDMRLILLGLAAGLVARAFPFRRASASRWKTLSATAAAGAVLAGLVCYALPKRYVSTASIRLYPGSRPGVPPQQRLQFLSQGIFSRSNLAYLILKPSLNLYAAERQRRPLEDIVQEMKDRRLRISPLPVVLESQREWVQISFEYPDRVIAQAVTREIVAALTEQNVIEDQKGGLKSPDRSVVLEMMDAPNLPERPISPLVPAVPAIGLAAGLLFGVLAIGWRLLPVKLAVATAVVGAAIGGAWTFAMPARYVSTAMLRIRSNEPDAAVRIDRRVKDLQSLDRNPNLHIDAHSPEVMIAFEHNDPEKAAAAVQNLVNNFVEFAPPARNIEVVDPASQPEYTSSPDRLRFAAIGLVAGLLLGTIAGFVRLRFRALAAA